MIENIEERARKILAKAYGCHESEITDTERRAVAVALGELSAQAPPTLTDCSKALDEAVDLICGVTGESRHHIEDDYRFDHLYDTATRIFAIARKLQSAQARWEDDSAITLSHAKLVSASGLMLAEIDTCGHEVDPAYRETLHDAWSEGKALIASASEVKRMAKMPRECTTTKLRRLIADDGYAMTFQTMGQYRTALLAAIDDSASGVSDD